ncbi:DUF3857 domain-containing protein [Allohahella marinimesophila]|uniref:DUF3857 domain-containing protein n=1 Tax=Allohahella marinimesophila TaxID=1054972 RepID=A0ABP7NTE0_9GAMM
MLSTSRVLAIGLLVLAASMASAQSEAMPSEPAFHSFNGYNFRYSQSPDWVHPVRFDDTPAAEGKEGAVHYHLVDEQIRVDDSETTAFRRYVKRPLTIGGIEEASKLEVRFNPAFEALVFHRAGVWRKGVFESRFDAKAVRILNAERDYESDILTGQVTALLYLKDVRSGDDIEIAYSIVGRNPTLGDRFAHWFALNWTQPVARRTIRILMPHQRPLKLQNYNHDLAPITSRLGSDTVFEWDVRNGPVMVDDGDYPAEYDAQRAVSVSEYDDWQSVADWAQPLYPIETVTSAEYAALVAELKQLPRPAALMRALGFVQNEIRYVSLSFGSNAFRPHRPDDVLEARYGDCKDKTLLLLHLLQAIGIEAHPALVSTTRQAGIATIAPMPDIFDHIIVRAVVEGKTYWLDGTRRFQGTSLDTVGMADFGYALVLASQQSGGGLKAIEISSNYEPKQHVIERIVVSAYDEPARYEVDTVYEGSFAESERSALAESGRSKLEQQYLTYQKDIYKGLTLAEPLAVEDDVAENRIVIKERYEIADFLTLEEGWLSYGVSPYGIDTVLQMPEKKQRTGPAYIGSPGMYRSTVSVQMPHAFISGDDVTFQKVLGPISYDYSQSDDGRTVTAEQTLHVRNHALPAEAMPELSALHESIADRQWVSSVHPENTPTVAFLRKVIMKIQEL